MARNFGGNRRMEKDWSAIPSISLALTADGTFGGASNNPGVSSTVLRMIGEYVIGPTSSPAALDDVKITLGIGVVSADAQAVGPGSLPDPAGEPNYSWLFWAEHHFFYATTSADPKTEQGSLRRGFDIRSMRKMKAGQALVYVVQYADIVGTPPMQVQLSQTRVLFGNL